MDDLLIYNSMGLIPGPNEAKEDFDSRVSYCLKLKENVLPQLFNKEVSFPTFLQEAFPATQSLYGIKPGWVSLIFSNEKLALWHGGAAWIFQMENDSPTAALLQLRKNFLFKNTYLGLLHRKELIAHELSHIGRMMFEEPLFEEMLAYSSSRSWFSRTFGPIIQSSRESLFFVMALLLILAFDAMAILQENISLLRELAWLKLIPLGLGIAATWRLFKNRKKLRRCLRNLKAVTTSDEKAHAIAYRLTDNEILHFAKSMPTEILSYIEKQTELRWQVIKTAYLS